MRGPHGQGLEPGACRAVGCGASPGPGTGALRFSARDLGQAWGGILQWGEVVGTVPWERVGVS